ncbi:hypothetical protein [Diplocloster modestus]|nr:hypothetical protein [Diplocloster modestus]
MKKKEIMNLQLFAVPENITTTTDLEPAISVDFTTRLSTNITELQNLLGIVDLDPMSAGTIIKIYKMTQVNTPAQVGEGEEISLTKIKQELARQVELTLKKFRKQTTAEAIQRSGRELAINKTDEKLLSGIQKEIKKTFYDLLGTGTGAASGVGLQAALSSAWGAVKKFYEDEDATPIFFVSSDDVAAYLGNAQVTMQTAFGMSYIQDFLGLGTLVVAPSLPAGKLIATAKENLRGAYVPAGSGDLATSFGLTADATGLIGMTHATTTGNASIETLMFSGVIFYPEFMDGVIVSTIKDAEVLDELTVTSAAGTASGDTKITVVPALTSGNSYKYKVAANPTLPAYNATCTTGYSAWDGTADITAATGQKIVIVEVDVANKAKKAGMTTVTAKA